MPSIQNRKAIDWDDEPQPGLRAISEILRGNSPVIPRCEIYNTRNIAVTFRRCTHAEGRVIDVYLFARKTNQKLLGDELAQIVIQDAKQSELDNVIWNRRNWNLSRGGLGPTVACICTKTTFTLNPPSQWFLNKTSFGTAPIDRSHARRARGVHDTRKTMA